MKRSKKKQRQLKLSAVETVLQMEGLSSKEYFHLEDTDQGPQRVLMDINLTVKRSESWGIYGRSAFDIKLLLEIIANIKPYHGGRCVLVELGMMRSKRVILEHVFYIGGSTMLYNNMNVLEYLMFATAKQKFDSVYRQESIFEFLINVGLGHISLTPIRMLTKEEKAVITLLAAAYSNSIITVFNVPEYQFNETLSLAIGKISKLITKKKNALILGTKNPFLIENACSHTAYITDGELIYKGLVKDLRLDYDMILFIIKDKNAADMLQSLADRLPGHELSIDGDRLLISDRGGAKSDPLQLYETIIEAGFAPQCIKVNPKTVQNAYEEIGRLHDLQKQLPQQGAPAGVH
ncbi:MAG: hypothetical protein WCS98_07960 [Bacillota bacterium]|nr:hypothetical protein [Bacillota bacterium]